MVTTSLYIDGYLHGLSAVWSPYEFDDYRLSVLINFRRGHPIGPLLMRTPFTNDPMTPVATFDDNGQLLTEPTETILKFLDGVKETGYMSLSKYEDRLRSKLPKDISWKQS